MSRERPPPPGSPASLEAGTRDHYLDAALYDFEYRDQTADVAWYRELAQARAGDGPVVELGAGTGRITLPLARAGHRVIAVDRMLRMLDRLRLKLADEPVEVAARIDAVEADIASLPLDDSSVPLVIAPFNVLQHLYRWQDLLACFREVRRVLVPGGTFGFDVLMPDLQWLLWEADKRHSTTRFVHPTTGERLVYTTNHTYDPATQVCHVRIYYDRAPDRGRFRPPPRPLRLVHLAHRQIFPEEIRALLAAADLELETHGGDFDGGPLAGTVESQVVLARRPG
jgi:SAM-dependent methyltransferase